MSEGCVWESPEVAAVFACQRCGACCRGGERGMSLTRAELLAIAARLRLSPEMFLARYCVKGGGRPSLRRGKDGLCLLWGKKGCLAWEVKPRACSLWPFPAALLEDPGTLPAVRASCPGLSPEAAPKALERALKLVQAAYPAPTKKAAPQG